MTHHLPHIRPGQSVGLLGGSFDPPHLGHVAISEAALRRFGLDQLFWLVSPGNPLKENAPAALDRRIEAARGMLDHPRIKVSDIEAHLGTRYTAETLRALRRAHPGVRFVWLMGADNLAQFHRWKDWREILETVPVGVLARPGDRIRARLSPAARIYRHAKMKGRASQQLGRAKAPAWCFLNVPMVDLSSSEIRARGDWAREDQNATDPAQAEKRA
ncbi:nicotinate-nucleotide adenylyltransferase [Tritonibacter aquimaris]|uniref:nicotinate-nucleotide adenylyltransferase n=1 Tax=Tritonibacter aquimaris TaxID=2663379 RepID=UPI002E26F5D4